MKEEDKTYYEVLSKAYHESSVQFDKQILFISSGVFGLSFTFIKDIVKLDKAEYQWILMLSWILFIAVILMSLVSHYTSKQAINKQMESLENGDDNQANSINKITVILNIAMIIAIVLGLITLISFVFINI